MQLSREEFGRIHGAFVEYVDALKKAGALVGNNGLRPTSEARTVRKTSVLDGPFAETKEQLLGFYLVDCASLEEAIEVAREMGRGESGAFEVRPVRLFRPGVAPA